MRAGWLVSAVGHVGAVMMTMLAWEARSTEAPRGGVVVPVEIVAVAPESNVRALAEDIPEDDLAPDPREETTPEVSAPPISPGRRPREQTYEEWLEETRARLEDHSREEGRQRHEGQTAERNQAGAGPGTAEVVALEDRARALARAHLRRCWRMPIDLPDPDRLIVTVEFTLNRNGTLNGQPRVTSPRNYTFDPAMRTAAEAALRAVRQCDPYPFPDDPVVGEHYDIWRETEFTFRPSF